MADKKDDTLGIADEYAARARDRGDPLLGHRERVMYRLSILAIVSLLPFPIHNFIHGRYALAASVLATVLVFLINAVAIHFNRQPPIPFVLLLLPMCGAMAVSMSTQGIHGAFWAYPATLFFYFVTPRRTATLASIALLMVSSALVASYVAVDVSIRFAVALILTIVIINVILNVIVKLQNKLLDQGIRDPLTGAFNRRHMVTCLGQAIERAGRTGTTATVLMFDIDHFKKINDQFGHAAGDKALISIVTLLEGRLRKLDCLFRIGGEEFIVLLPETHESDAVAVAEEIRVRVAEAHLFDGPPTTVSIGLAGLTPSDSLDTWIRRADDALYRAKASGRNQVMSSAS